jgi:DNA repair protein RadC
MTADDSLCTAKAMIPQVKLVRVGRVVKGQKIDSDTAAFDFWKRVVLRQPWFDEDREAAIALMLDTKTQVKAWNLVSVGTDKRCFMDAKGVFRCAVACSAASVIVMHHHPSGDCKPSKEDLNITHYLVRAGKLLGICVLDHLIVGGKEYCSLRDEYPEMFEASRQAVEIAAD